MCWRCCEKRSPLKIESYNVNVKFVKSAIWEKLLRQVIRRIKACIYEEGVSLFLYIIFVWNWVAFRPDSKMRARVGGNRCQSGGQQEAQKRIICRSVNVKSPHPCTFSVSISTRVYVRARRGLCCGENALGDSRMIWVLSARNNGENVKFTAIKL